MPDLITETEAAPFALHRTDRAAAPRLAEDGRSLVAEGGLQSAVVAVTDLLEQRIVNGSLPTGATLTPERALAPELGVSRATLRQALAILTQKGLVASRRGRSGGIVVTTPSVATVASTVTLLFKTNVVTTAQLTEVRRGLEVEAAQLAAARRSAADLARLKMIRARYVASEDDILTHNECGRQLHLGIAETSGNPLLVQMMHSLEQAIAESVELLSTLAESRGTADALHRPIIDAIALQDGEAARWAMIRHFEDLERMLAEHHFAQRELGRLRLA